MFVCSVEITQYLISEPLPSLSELKTHFTLLFIIYINSQNSGGRVVDKDGQFSLNIF